MRRIGTVLVVVLAVLAAAALPVVGVPTVASTADIGDETRWGQTEPADESGNETETAPGTRLAGSVGVQGAELGGELETRSFSHQVNRSNSSAAKAQVVARQANQSQTRLRALRAEFERLEAARANDSLSESAYRVRVAQASARAAALERVTNRTSQAANILPEAALRQHGVDRSALERLRTDADQLTGPAVAAIARSVAGPGAARGNGVGQAANASKSQGASGSTGPPEEAPGRSENAREVNANAVDDSASSNETATDSPGRSGGPANGAGGGNGPGDENRGNGGANQGDAGDGGSAGDARRSGAD